MRVGLFLTRQQRLNVDMVAAFDEHVAMVRHARDAAGDARGALRARPFDELLSGRFGPGDVPLAEDADLVALLAGMRGG